MFQCPVCRQVANLEASVQEPEDFEKETAAFIDDEDESSVDGDAMNLEQQPSSTLPETSFMEPQDRGLTLSRSHDIVAPVHSLQIREESSSPMDIPAPPLPHLASSLAHSPSTPLNNSHMPARMDRTASNSTGDLLMVMDDIHPTYGALQKIISAASNGDQSVLQQEMLQYANRMKQLLESTLNVDPDTQTQIVSQLLGSIPPNHDSA